ncbi:MAG: lysylphosphatidylglycerol synthase transmembrane domain-containing protein, partial [Acidimicrobiia bacterium]
MTTPRVSADLLPPEPPPEASQPGAVVWLRKNLFGSVASTIVSVVLGVALFFMLRGLLAYLFSTTDLTALKERVRSGDTFLLVLAMALYGLIIAISIWRWKLLLHTQGYRATMGHLSASYLVATFFNNFLPSNIGGDVIRVR